MTQPSNLSAARNDPTDKTNQTQAPGKDVRKPVASLTEQGKRAYQYKEAETKIGKGKFASESSAAQIADEEEETTPSLFALASGRAAQAASDEESVEASDPDAESPSKGTSVQIPDSKAPAKTAPTPPRIATGREMSPTHDVAKAEDGVDRKTPSKPEIDPRALSPVVASPMQLVQAHVVMKPDTPDPSTKAREALIKIVQQMAEELKVVKSPDRTEVSVTLQYPPLFKGASVVITEFALNEKQFNVAFYNLTPEAQNLISMAQNQDTLRTQLLEKGYQLGQLIIAPKQDAIAPVLTEDTPGARKKGSSDSEDEEEQGPTGGVL